MLFSWNVRNGKLAAGFEYVQPTFAATDDILVDPKTNVLLLSTNTVSPPSAVLVYSLRTAQREKRSRLSIKLLMYLPELTRDFFVIK